MTVRCDCDSCKHWKEDAAVFIGEGGCTLDEIKISDNTMTGAGFIAICTDYEEGSDE